MEQNRLSKEKVIPAQMCSCEYCKIFKDMFLKFNESAFWSWNIIILSFLWKTFHVHFIK